MDNTASEFIVEALGVHKDFPMGLGIVTALKDVTLRIRRGAFTVIAGPSGSGKSTLLNLLGCLDRPNSGTIRIAGRDVMALSDAMLSGFRAKRLGFVFQNFNLISVLNAFENVEYPLRLNHVPRSEARERAMAMLAAVGIADRAGHRPAELSGGQRQRVAIARALVTRPDVVLADEPTANLDSRTGEQIVDLMREMQQESRTAFVIATHDPMVSTHAGEFHTMHDGQLDAA